MSTNEESLTYLNYEEAIDNYEEDVVELALSEFILKTYKDLKEKMPVYLVDKNYKEMRTLVHNLKTNSCYMGAEKFSELCAEMQRDCEKKDDDNLSKNYEIFMNNIDKLYEGACKVYKDRFGKTIEQNLASDKEIIEDKTEGEEVKEDKKLNTISNIGIISDEQKERKGEISPIPMKNYDEDNTPNINKLCGKEMFNLKLNGFENQLSNDNKDNNNETNKDINDDIEDSNDHKDNDIDSCKSLNAISNSKFNVTDNKKTEKKEEENIKNISDNLEALNKSCEEDNNKTNELIKGILLKFPKKAKKINKTKNAMFKESQNSSVLLPNINSFGEYNKTKRIKSCIHLKRKYIFNYQDILKYFKESYYSVSFKSPKNVRNLDLFLRKKTSFNSQADSRKITKKYEGNDLSGMEEEMNLAKLGYSEDKELCIALYDEAILKNSASVVDDAIISYKTLLYPKVTQKIKEILNMIDDNKDKSLINNEMELAKQKNWMFNAVKDVLNNIQVFLNQKAIDVFYRILIKMEKCSKKEKFKKLLSKIYKNMANFLIIVNVIIKSKIYSNNPNLISSSTSNELPNKDSDYSFSTNIKKEKNKYDKKMSIVNDKKNKNNISFSNKENKEIKRIKKNTLLQLESETLTKNSSLSIVQNHKMASGKKDLLHNIFKVSSEDLKSNIRIENDYIEQSKTPESYRDKYGSLYHIYEKGRMKKAKYESKNSQKLSEKKKFTLDVSPFMKFFREAIDNKDNEELMEILYEFREKILDKYGFYRLRDIVDRWNEEIACNEFDDLNIKYSDIEDLIQDMKKSLSKGNYDNTTCNNTENTIELNIENNIYNNIEDNITNMSPINNNINRTVIDKDRANDIREISETLDYRKCEEALLKDLKQFNIGTFFHPNSGVNQRHENFKQQLELLAKDLNSNENRKTGEDNNPYTVRKSQHIKLSKKFKNRRNQFFDFSYPFKEEEISIMKFCNIY